MIQSATRTRKKNPYRVTSIGVAVSFSTSETILASEEIGHDLAGVVRAALIEFDSKLKCSLSALVCVCVHRDKMHRYIRARAHIQSHTPATMDAHTHTHTRVRGEKHSNFVPVCLFNRTQRFEKIPQPTKARA